MNAYTLEKIELRNVQYNDRSDKPKEASPPRGAVELSTLQLISIALPGT